MRLEDRRFVGRVTQVVAPWPPADHRRSITCDNQAAALVWLVLGSCGCRLVRGQTGKARGVTSRCA